LSGDTVPVLSECATWMENWTSGHCRFESVGNRAPALSANYLDGGGWSMAQKAMENAKLVITILLFVPAKHESYNRGDLNCTSGDCPTDLLAGTKKTGWWEVTWLATWLILPVVIRSSQRLSHACLSINTLL
jgi:hypothetical protein